MKRLICILLALLMLGSWALAEGDLQSMTFDELIELQTKITEEITKREEFQNQVNQLYIQSITKLFPKGVFILIQNEKGVFTFQISEKVISFKSKLEALMEQAANIPITIDEEAYQETQAAIERTLDELNGK